MENIKREIIEIPNSDDWYEVVDYFYDYWREIKDSKDIYKIGEEYYLIGDWNYAIECFGWDNGLSEYISWGKEDMIERSLLIPIIPSEGNVEDDKETTKLSFDFREKIIDYILEVDFKPLLEMDEEVSDAYDNGDISSDDFHSILSELKEKMKK